MINVTINSEHKAIDFSLYAIRFYFRALDPIYFPPGKAGNIFRGAFGHIFRRIACLPECASAKDCSYRKDCPYARIFEPELAHGPSGFADPPRPFVLRAAHLDGLSLKPGETFHMDLHLFRIEDPGLFYFVLTFVQLAKQGIGPGRGRAELINVVALDAGYCESGNLLNRKDFSLKLPTQPICFPLKAPNQDITRVQVVFVTPTEIKAQGQILTTAPDFAFLFARARDRVSGLRVLYGSGPLNLDFCGMAERAKLVKTLNSSIHGIDISRKSSRSGWTHGIGGLTGKVGYEGNLGEFIPILQAAYWTGIGRHTVWGCGVTQINLTF